MSAPSAAARRNSGSSPVPSPTNSAGRSLVDKTGPVTADWTFFSNQEVNNAPSFGSAYRGPPTQSYEVHEVKRYSVDAGELPRQRSNSLTQEGPLSGSRSPGFAAVTGGLPPRTSSVSPGVPRTASERSPAYTPRSTGSQPHSPTVGSDGVRRSSVDMGATHPTDWSVFMNQQQQPAAPRSTEGTPRGPPTQSYETHETRRYSVDIDHLPRRDSNSSAFPPLPPQDGTTTTESHEVLKYSAAQ